jgi:uncharacterized OB-fold protein
MRDEEQNDATPATVRMNVSYCQRCGALRIHPAAEKDRICPHCRRETDWIKQEGRNATSQL